MDASDLISNVADALERHIGALARIETDPAAGLDALRAATLQDAIVALHTALQHLRSVAAALAQRP